MSVASLFRWVVLTGAECHAVAKDYKLYISSSSTFSQFQSASQASRTEQGTHHALYRWNMNKAMSVEDPFTVMGPHFVRKTIFHLKADANNIVWEQSIHRMGRRMSLLPWFWRCRTRAKLARQSGRLKHFCAIARSQSLGFVKRECLPKCWRVLALAVGIF